MMQQCNINKKLPFIDKCIIWLLILSPVLQIYGVGPLNLCEFLTWVGIGIGILKHRLDLKMPILLLYYFIYLLSVTFISCFFNFSELIGRSFGVIHSFLVFALFFSIKDIDYLYKSYKYFVFAAITLFFAQEVSYAVTGVRISGLIPFLPLNSTFSDFENTYSFHDFLKLVKRSSSFFSEPAHFAQFLLPFLPLSLYLESGLKKAIYPSLVVISLYMLQSGNGIIGLSVLLVIYTVYYFHYLSIGYKVVLVVFVSFFFVFVAHFLADSEIGQQYLGRSGELLSTTDSAEDASGFVRIYLGYYVYNEYDIFEKIIGINNFVEIQSKISQSSYGSLLNGVLYFNTIQNYLIKAGLIGLLFFLLLLRKIYRENNICGKSIVITFFVLSFMSSMYLTPVMILYLLFALRIRLVNI